VSRDTIKPHLVKAQESLSPHVQTVKDICGPYIDQVVVVSQPHILGNYQAGSRVLQAHQITSSQEHAKQDLNGLANLLPGKMLALHQRGSNLSANTPVFVHSSVSSTGPSARIMTPFTWAIFARHGPRML
jgi:hypothetical protein